MSLDRELTRARALWLRLCVEGARLHTGQRGQQMVEYSLITWSLLLGLALGGIGLPVNGNMSLAAQVYSAFQTYVMSIFFTLARAAV